MKITFTAIDGMNFEKEEDCLEHETFLSEKTNLIFEAISNSIGSARIIRANEGMRQEILNALPTIKNTITSEITKKYPQEVSNIFQIYALLINAVSKKEDLDDIETKIDEYGGVFYFYDNLKLFENN
jgi:hypothetical protein